MITTSLRWTDSPPLACEGQQIASPRRGVVLIVVLVLVIMIALAGFGFLAAMSTEYEAARLNGSMLQAQQTMASAESSLSWLTGLPERERHLMGGWYHNPALFRGRVVPQLNATGGNASTTRPGMPADQSMSLDNADDRWRFSVVSLDVTPEQSRVLRFGLQNESTKLHLASLLRWEQATPGQGRVALMQLPSMTDTIADAILDWMDADDQPREFGAETEYYQSLDRPYRAANAVPQRLTELLYVKGITRQMLMGFPTADLLTLGSENSQAARLPGPDGSDAAPVDPMTASLGWSQFLTIHSAERVRNRSGQPRVFLNAGSLAVLEQQLRSVLPENIVRYLLLARVYAVTPSPGTGVDPSAAPFALSMIPAFPIMSVADLIDSVIQVPTASGTVVVQSPLQSSSPEFLSLLNSLLDQTTTFPETVIYGRINLISASETVLRTIPGLTPELASQIVTQRGALESEDANSVAWLLTDNVMDIATFRRVLPEITTGGDVFQGEIIVHRAIGGPMLRRNLILDAASSPVRRVHWQDVTDTPMTFSSRMLLPMQQ